MQQVIFKKQLDFTLLVVKRETEEKKKVYMELQVLKGWSPVKIQEQKQPDNAKFCYLKYYRSL